MQNMGEQFYKDLLKNIQIGVYFVNTNDVITFFNKIAENITGYTYAEVVNKKTESLFHQLDERGVVLENKQLMQGSAKLDGGVKIFIRHKDGHRVPVKMSSYEIFDSESNVVGYVKTFVDILNIKRLESTKENLKILAMVDKLTSLPNKRYLEEWLVAKHREYIKFSRTYAVLIVDIDNFMKVSNTYGKNVSTRMLSVVAKTLSGANRSTDLVARFAADQFAIVLSGIDSSEIHTVAKRIGQLVYNSNIKVGNNLISVSVSVGGAVVSDSDDVKSLMMRADEYMYKAKVSGKNRVCTEFGLDVIGRELNK